MIPWTYGQEKSTLVTENHSNIMNRKIWKNLFRASNGVCQRQLISSYILSPIWYLLVHLTTGDLCVWGAGHLRIKRLVKTTNSVWLKSYKITFGENRVLFLNTFKATDAWILTEECFQSLSKVIDTTQGC